MMRNAPVGPDPYSTVCAGNAEAASRSAGRRFFQSILMTSRYLAARYTGLPRPAPKTGRGAGIALERQTHDALQLALRALQCTRDLSKIGGRDVGVRVLVLGMVREVESFRADHEFEAVL